MRSLLPLRSLTIKLGLVLFGLVFVVIAVLLLFVVPRLESRLVDARIDRLEADSPPVTRELRRLTEFEITEGTALAVLAASHEARVVILTRLDADSLNVFGDSALARSDVFAEDPLALRALQTGMPQRGQSHAR